MLIGHEIQGVLRWIESKGFDRDRPPQIRLAGSASLCARYDRVLASCGMADGVTISNASAIGLWQIAVRANLVPALSDSGLKKGSN